MFPKLPKMPKLGLKKRFKLKKKENKPYLTTPVEIKLVLDEDDEKLNRANIPDSSDGIKIIKSSRSAEDDIFASLNGSSHRESFRFEPNSKYTTIFIYGVLFIIAAVLVVAGLYKGVFFNAIKKFLSAISAFVIGFFLALILDPPTSWLDSNLFEKGCKIKNVRVRRILSLLISYLLVFGLLFILVRFVVPQIGNSMNDLYLQVDNIIATLTKWVTDIEEFIPGMELGTIEKKLAELDTQKIISTISGFVPQIVNFAGSIFKGAWNILIALIVSMYMLYDKRNLTIIITKITYSLFPISRANKLTHTTKECINIFVNFVFGKSLDSLIIGILSFIVLSAFGYPYAVLMAMIIGVTNMIPYFGPFIGAVPGLFIYLVNSGLKEAFIFVVIILVIQQLDGWIIGPKILGDSTGLSPLWVILGTTLGGAYGGVIGMFLGVPVIAVIAYLMQNLISDILARKKIDIS